MSTSIDKAKGILQHIIPSSHKNTMTESLPKSYKAAVVEEVNGNFVFKDVPLEQPKYGEILVKVLACGVCGSDVGTIAGHMGPMVQFPIVTGHEIVGDVVAIPEGEDHWKVGDRVGGGWHGGHCGFCVPCKRGQFVLCKKGEVNGISRPGGFAEYVLLRREAVVDMPTDISPEAGAPLLCAGVTVFNSLRNQGLQQGSLVAIQGLGGLGHLALQYASKMGYKVAALSSSADKKDHAMKLGANYFIDQSAEDGNEALQKLGGADVVICTAGNPKLISPLTKGLAPSGTVLILSPVPEVSVAGTDLILGSTKVAGWASGSSIDCEEAVDFAKIFGVNAIIEKYPFDKVQECFHNTQSGHVRFRGVLIMQ